MPHNIYHVDIAEQQATTVEVVKTITSFNIDLSDLTANGGNRTLTINCDPDSKFNLQIFNSSANFYDFSTGTFSSGFSNSKNLNTTTSGSTYSVNIAFPATGNTT